jgi:hypothetical protein
VEFLELLSLDTIQYLVKFASYTLISFIGSLIREIHWTNTDSDHDFTPLNVIASTITASTIALLVSQLYSDFIDQYWGIMGIISLFFGFVGYEAFKYLSSLVKLVKLIIFREVSVEDIEESSDEDTKRHKGHHKKRHKHDEENEDDEDEECDKKIHINIPTINHDQIELIHCHIERPEIHKPGDNTDISYEKSKKEPTE